MEIVTALLITAIAAAATIVGAIIAKFTIEEIKENTKYLILIEVIVMLAVSFILACESFKLNSILSIIGLFFGGLAMIIIQKFVPHEHHQRYYKLDKMLLIGMALHEFPEGVGLGASFLLNNPLPLFISLMITFHNIPEGSLIALPLILANKGKWKIIKRAGISQIFFVLGSLLGYFFSFEFVKPLILNLSSGAMIFIALEEIFEGCLK